VSLHTVDWDKGYGFGIQLTPDHLEALREALAELDAIAQPAEPIEV